MWLLGAALRHIVAKLSRDTDFKWPPFEMAVSRSEASRCDGAGAATKALPRVSFDCRVRSRRCQCLPNCRGRNRKQTLGPSAQLSQDSIIVLGGVVRRQSSLLLNIRVSAQWCWSVKVVGKSMRGTQAGAQCHAPEFRRFVLARLSTSRNSAAMPRQALGSAKSTEA